MKILRALDIGQPLTFTELLSVTSLSPGNLSIHARKLVEAGYAKTKRFFLHRIPRTEFRITAAGRKALRDSRPDTPETERC